MIKREGYNNWDKVFEELKKLNEYQVAVGFFGERNSRLLTIVRANEYGAHIVPKKGNWLTIPTRYARGDDGLPKKPSEIEGLRRSNKKNVLYTKSKNGKIKVYFYLVKEVTIPSRPFMRTALLENGATFKRLIEKGVNNITFEGGTADKLLNQLGTTAVALMRQSAIRLSKPVNAPATVDYKRSNNPLVDTGNLQRSITYKIIPI
ncbi:hypothetical protein J2Z60_001067 [Lactobacillus colini]|uniref:Uncharacterized protein n=1 Tax=Lactobacillus colini TaxID=1819254 RepID=A0ABS4MDY3_9LACO|nr:hypothetical protein [Lactobacillus colini]MBP2057892.1 hypothetical protein [Lactobacillus colini]